MLTAKRINEFEKPLGFRCNALCCKSILPLPVSYLLWKSYKVYFKRKRYPFFQRLLSRTCSTLLNTAGEKFFYAQHWLVNGRLLFILYFPLINLLIEEWGMCETVYIPIPMCAFSISRPQTTGITCLLLRPPGGRVWQTSLPFSQGSYILFRYKYCRV